MKNKIALCWIGIGSYNCLFEMFYESFKTNFCKECEVTFFIFTDQPEISNSFQDCMTYVVSHSCKHTGYVLFRKFKYLLMAEDAFLDYDYVAFMNGNCICQKAVSLHDMMPNPDFITCITHPYASKEKIRIHSDPRTQAFCIQKDQTYKQAAVFMMKSKEFLRIANQIEAWRMQDKANGTDRYIGCHDEEYWNKLTFLNRTRLNVLSGKVFACPNCQPYHVDAKIITRQKDSTFKQLNKVFPKKLTADVYQLDNQPAKNLSSKLFR